MLKANLTLLAEREPKAEPVMRTAKPEDNDRRYFALPFPGNGRSPGGKTRRLAHETESVTLPGSPPYAEQPQTESLEARRAPRASRDRTERRRTRETSRNGTGNDPRAAKTEPNGAREPAVRPREGPRASIH